MQGNPFFIQERPGKDEKIFKLVKFRTMTNKKDKEGKLLPDDQRLTKYGKFLRSTSLDEIPELWNIFTGDLALIGPRPVSYTHLDVYKRQALGSVASYETRLDLWKNDITSTFCAFLIRKK